jgi:hypothetical protein
VLTIAGTVTDKRKEQPVEHRGRIPVVHEASRVGEQAHAEEPLLIEGQSREVIWGQVIEQAPRIFRPPEPGV